MAILDMDRLNGTNTTSCCHWQLCKPLNNSHELASEYEAKFIFVDESVKSNFLLINICKCEVHYESSMKIVTLKVIFTPCLLTNDGEDR